jgi:hypothetical protein
MLIQRCGSTLIQHWFNVEMSAGQRTSSNVSRNKVSMSSYSRAKNIFVLNIGSVLELKCLSCGKMLHTDLNQVLIDFLITVSSRILFTRLLLHQCVHCSVFWGHMPSAAVSDEQCLMSLSRRTIRMTSANVMWLTCVLFLSNIDRSSGFITKACLVYVTKCLYARRPTSGSAVCNPRQINKSLNLIKIWIRWRM